jgi:hypothetical protein
LREKGEKSKIETERMDAVQKENEKEGEKVKRKEGQDHGDGDVTDENPKTEMNTNTNEAAASCGHFLKAINMFSPEVLKTALFFCERDTTATPSVRLRPYHPTM